MNDKEVSIKPNNVFDCENMRKSSNLSNFNNK